MKPTLVFAALLTVTGCAKEEAPAPTAVVAQATVPQVAVSKPADQPNEISGYHAVGKRDPFEPPVLVTPAPYGPTQEHPVRQYLLIGTVAGTAIPTAMIRTPEGEEYALRVGSPLGNSGGRVTSITRGRLVVSE